MGGKEFMRIGEIAEKTGLNVSHIRFYERKGLLDPERKSGSKYRNYSEEDVGRIKLILLYRKMGISIDTIYLLINGKTEIREVIVRQQAEIKHEMEDLSGSLKLCEMVLDREAGEIAPARVDAYLNYVHEEEKRGARFIEASELLEDVTDYTRDSMPHFSFLWFSDKPWVPALFSVLLWGILFACPVIHVIEVLLGKSTLSIPLLISWGLILIIYSNGFIKFRNLKYERMDPDGDQERKA